MNESTSNEGAGKSLPSRARSRWHMQNEMKGQKKQCTRRTRMSEKKKDELLNDHNHDGIDRRGFLKCMAWAGTGALYVMQGGVLKSYSLSRLPESRPKESLGELSFVQISDSHMGFNKPANPDVAGTLKAAVD